MAPEGIPKAETGWPVEKCSEHGTGRVAGPTERQIISVLHSRTNCLLSENCLSHERTVQQLMTELDHVFGFKTRLRQSKSGYYLEGPNGETCSLGEGTYGSLLSPRDQEAICENFGLDAALMGLDPWMD
ncbi:MAG TPA: hypothetical protein VHU81_04950 [Thermoanaerobaculia bacterium]|nr:hypothetical protein [Thermoanaerobaculia bacterium]